MASVRKRNGLWRIRWRDLAGRQREVALRGCSTAKEARRISQECEAALDAGRDWQPGRARSRATLGALLDAYKAHRVASGLKASTCAKDGDILAVLAAFVMADTGDEMAPATVLTLPLLDRYVAHLRAERGCGPRTVRHHVVRVLDLWRFGQARADDYPGMALAPHRYRTATPVDRQAAAPTWAEVDALIAHLARKRDRALELRDRAAAEGRTSWRPRAVATTAEAAYRAAWVQRFTGLRIAQALAVEWTDFDFTAQTFHLRPEIAKTTAEASAARTIPVSPHLLAELATWGRRDGPVCGDAEYHAVYERIRSGWKAAGVPERAWKGSPTHALRDLVSTGLREAGCAPEAVEFYLGHSLGTAGRYTDPRAHDLTACAEAFPPVATGAVVSLTVERERREK
jgi:integrase